MFLMKNDWLSAELKITKNQDSVYLQTQGQSRSQSQLNFLFTYEVGMCLRDK